MDLYVLLRLTGSIFEGYGYPIATSLNSFSVRRCASIVPYLKAMYIFDLKTSSVIGDYEQGHVLASDPFPRPSLHMKFDLLEKQRLCGRGSYSG